MTLNNFLLKKNNSHWEKAGIAILGFFLGILFINLFRTFDKNYVCSVCPILIYVMSNSFSPKNHSLIFFLFLNFFGVIIFAILLKYFIF